MIIDCHTHIFPKEMQRDRKKLCESDSGFASIYGLQNAKMIGAEELIASMDECGVNRSVVCGFSWRDPVLCTVHNDYLMECIRRYPDRLIAFVTVTPVDTDRSLEELQLRLRQGAKGVGEIAFYEDEMTPRDMERMGVLLSFLKEKRVALLLHTNETLGHRYPGKGKTPLDRFYDLIVRFPGLPMILAHWGGGLPFYELMTEVAKEMASVFYDTAASPFLYRKNIYGIVAEIVGVEKILFGTDYPLISPKRYFREIEDSSLTAEDRKKILGLNIANLLQLPG